MPTFAALLRGINVAGHRKIRMTELAALFAEAGCESVTTYIQSGNVVFTHRTRSAEKLRVDLEDRIEAATGFDVVVVLRTASELAKVIANTPFPDADPSKLAVSFLIRKPASGALDKVDASAFAPDEFALVGREIYLHLPNGFGRAKLPPVLDAKAPGTVRNWRTVTMLHELTSG
jgi:uncharacterized protein (DUF1697 family)